MNETEELSAEDDFRSACAAADVLPWDLNREDGRLTPAAFEHLKAQDPERLRAALGELVQRLYQDPRLQKMDPQLAQDLADQSIPARELALRAVCAAHPLWKFELGFLGKTANSLVRTLHEGSINAERSRSLVGAWKGAADQAVPGLATRGLALNFDPATPNYGVIPDYVGIHPYPMQNPVNPVGYQEALRAFYDQFKAADTGFRFVDDGRALRSL